MGGMTVLMTVSSASTLFGGGDVDNLVERTSPIIQSRPPKAIECQPAMSVWVTVLHYSMRAIVPSPQGFSPSIDNRVGIIVWHGTTTDKAPRVPYSGLERPAVLLRRSNDRYAVARRARASNLIPHRRQLGDSAAFRRPSCRDTSNPGQTSAAHAL
jgi:hypothetical protein